MTKAAPPPVRTLPVHGHPPGFSPHFICAFSNLRRNHDAIHNARSAAKKTRSTVQALPPAARAIGATTSKRNARRRRSTQGCFPVIRRHRPCAHSTVRIVARLPLAGCATSMRWSSPDHRYAPTRHGERTAILQSRQVSRPLFRLGLLAHSGGLRRRSAGPRSRASLGAGLIRVRSTWGSLARPTGGRRLLRRCARGSLAGSRSLFLSADRSGWLLGTLRLRAARLRLPLTSRRRLLCSRRRRFLRAAGQNQEHRRGQQY